MYVSRRQSYRASMIVNYDPLTRQRQKLKFIEAFTKQCLLISLDALPMY